MTLFEEMQYRELTQEEVGHMLYDPLQHDPRKPANSNIKPGKRWNHGMIWCFIFSILTTGTIFRIWWMGWNG